MDKAINNRVRLYRRPALCLSFLALLLPVSALSKDFTPATVLKVYDGDTILVELDSGRKEKVRLIGIDCPEAWENEKFERDMKREKRRSAREMFELGQRAKEFTEALCPPGSVVALEPDVEKRDRYGRFLAYVWIRQGPEAGGKAAAREILLNGELMKAGLAKQMTIPPNVKYMEDLRKLGREAREDRLGIWSK